MSISSLLVPSAPLVYLAVSLTSSQVLFLSMSLFLVSPSFRGHVIWNLQLILGSFKLSMSKLELILLPS